MLRNVLRMLQTFGGSVAKSALPHVKKTDAPFAGAIDELVAIGGMKFRCGDHFLQFFHIGRLDVHHHFFRK